jgi:hypothetical protein
VQKQNQTGRIKKNPNEKRTSFSTGQRLGAGVMGSRLGKLGLGPFGLELEIE